ncbi:MAG TPA: molybdopterin converting factor subunit 1 [Usitatibacter sp.]|nr:molybdopterin converting factor subunit 1 [Usitatibacter sp.]
MTTVTLLYFASLRERVGRSREELALAAGTPTVGALVEQLRARDGRFAEAFAPGRPWRVAVNQRMADPATPLEAGDEVAFFPPVTGG